MNHSVKSESPPRRQLFPAANFTQQREKAFWSPLFSSSKNTYPPNPVNTFTQGCQIKNLNLGKFRRAF
jgi:hypothetical protein